MIEHTYSLKPKKVKMGSVRKSFTMLLRRALFTLAIEGSHLRAFAQRRQEEGSKENLLADFGDLVGSRAFQKSTSETFEEKT